MLLLSIALPGCYKDKSGVGDHPIGSLSVTGLAENYNLVSFQDALQITPVVTSSDPSDTFEYLWTLYNHTLMSFMEIPVDTLARTKDLDYPLELAPGSYTVQLRVTASSGYSEYFHTILTAGTPYSVGFYLMKETTAGNTEVDFIDRNGKMTDNVIERVVGRPMEGAPRNLRILSGYYYINEETSETVLCNALVPTSEKDIKIISLNDLSLAYDHRSMFYGDEPDEVPVAIVRTIYYPFYISNRGTYASQQYTGNPGSGKYGFPVAPEGGCSYSKWVVVNASAAIAISLFDELNGRFVKVDYGNGVSEQVVNNGLSHSGIEHKLLFMGANSPLKASCSCWAIFQHKENPALRILYSVNSATTDPITFIETLDESLVFNTAQVFGALKATDRSVIYGGVDARLYLYNVTTGTEKQLYPTRFGADEEITMITHKNVSADENYLMIGTHKNGNYKVYLYELLAGEPYGEPVSILEGKGKVVDIQHSSTNNGYINY